MDNPNPIPEMDSKDEKLLNDIVESAATAKVLKKEDASKRHPKSGIPLKFDVPDSDDTSIKINLIKYINLKNYTYQDLFDYCISHLCNGDEEAGKRIAYRIISGLKSLRDIRVSTLDIICDFLGANVILEGRREDIKPLLNEVPESEEKEDSSKSSLKSNIPLKFDVPDPDDNSIKVNLIKYINSKNYTYQDLFDYCITHLCNIDEEAGKRVAYRIISGLKSMRDIRVSTLDVICDFLDADVILEERKRVS